MNSLCPSKSILDLLAINQQQTCRNCGKFVECVRLTGTPIYRNGRIWFGANTKSDTCQDCQIEFAGDGDERLRLQSDFDTMRAMRIELGLGVTQADLRVREALHITGQPTTTLWVEPAATPVRGIIAEIYTVLGDGIDFPSTDEAVERITPLSQCPAFSLFFSDPPAGFAGVAFVALAANIWSPAIPEAVVRLRWSPFNPTDYTIGFGSYRRFNALKAKERCQLITAASTVFDQWMPARGGRHRDDENVTCAQFKADLPAALARARNALEGAGEPRYRPLHQHELAAALGVHEDTLRSRMEQCTMDWETLRRRSGGRTDSR